MSKRAGVETQDRDIPIAWDPGLYGRFAGARLRPALDLIARVPLTRPAEIADLGCGAGAAFAALRARFPEARLVGVDTSQEMVETARETGIADEVGLADAATWRPARAPDLIFSNAVLQWLDAHETLFPRLFDLLAPGGVLAVQMPRNHRAPAFEALRAAARTVRPDIFDWSRYEPPVAEPVVYAEMLAGLPGLDDARFEIWETEYFQRLAPSDEGHPVRLFSQSTAARPILARLESEADRDAFLSAVDDRLAPLYPPRADGSVWYPFRRLFLIAGKRDNG